MQPDKYGRSVISTPDGNGNIVYSVFNTDGSPALTVEFPYTTDLDHVYYVINSMAPSDQVGQ